MKTKTIELTDAALDWAVAKCMGQENCWMHDYKIGYPVSTSTDWAQGGPIIEREGIDLRKSGDRWFCELWADNSGIAKNPKQRFQHNRYALGPTPLIAAMRCYVASKLGDEVDVPDELVSTT